MRTPPSLAVSLLLILSLLLSQAQGIRLEKGFSSVKPQNKSIHEDSSTGVTKKSERTAASGVLSKDCGQDDHCSSGSSRKLITVTASTTTNPTPKKEKNIAGKQVSNPKAESSSARSSDKHQEKEEEEEVATTRQQQYPDLIDMTEMDYSPARRKPPIHN